MYKRQIQALEAIKYLLGIGELLTGKMLVMDGLTMNTRVVKFPSKNKNCRVCGEHADITSVKENRMEYVGAVSYTHLDVYKRQDLQQVDLQKCSDVLEQH